MTTVTCSKQLVNLAKSGLTARPSVTPALRQTHSFVHLNRFPFTDLLVAEPLHGSQHAYDVAYLGGLCSNMERGSRSQHR